MPSDAFRPTKQFYQQICPDCGEFSAGEVRLGNEPRYWCDECGNRWAPSEIENCVECGDPLGGSEAICHSCWQKVDGGGDES